MYKLVIKPNIRVANNSYSMALIEIYNQCQFNQVLCKYSHSAVLVAIALVKVALYTQR